MASSTSTFVSPLPCLLVRRVSNPPFPRLCRVVSLSSLGGQDPDTTLSRLLSIQRAVLRRRNNLNAHSSSGKLDQEKPNELDSNPANESNSPFPSDSPSHEVDPINPASPLGASRKLTSTAKPVSPSNPSSSSTSPTTLPSAPAASFLSPTPTTPPSGSRHVSSSSFSQHGQILPVQTHARFSSLASHSDAFNTTTSCTTVSRYKISLPWKWKNDAECKPCDPVDEILPTLASFQTDASLKRTEFLFPRVTISSAPIAPPSRVITDFSGPPPLVHPLTEDENLRLASAESVLSDLNEEQRQAVIVDPSNPCLVLAGPGSGKTRVLTHRIAFLIHAHKVPPAAILSVTFTNKAAGEMKSRVAKLLRGFGSDTGLDSDTIYDRLTVGTFHWVCARLLRTYGTYIGISNNFQICDTEDSRVVLSRAMKKASNGDAPESRVVNMLLSLISKLKNDKGDELESRLTRTRFKDVVNWRELYDKDLRAMNMLDFDDLLVETRRLLQECPEVRAQLQDRYRYVLVDEWQDTNNVQFDMIALLAGKMNNLFVVGDVDQSIYKFRGADSGNIDRYMNFYKHANRVVLSMNYRSTMNIIKAAKEVIDQNSNRPEKNMMTINVDGERVKLLGVQSEWDEVQFVTKSIEKLVKGAQVESLSKCAVMYRTNAQSRLLEEACLLGNIPYVLQSGIRFFERREIKDLLSYLKVLYNPEDDSALLRVLNVPPRGIGKRTMELVEMYANRKGLSLTHAIHELMVDDASNDAVMEELNIRSATLKRVKTFHDIITELRLKAKSILQSPEEQDSNEAGHIGDVFMAIVDHINYFTYLSSEGSTESHAKSLDRVANVKELIRAASLFDDPSAFLQRAALMSGPMSEDSNNTSGAVWLSTLHGSKGLEFDAVYITGLEDGIVPLLRDGSIEDIEEERRLLYVGMTRAKRFLTMTWRRNRNSGKRGKSDVIPTKLSRFLTGVNGVEKKFHTVKPTANKRYYQQKLR